MRQFIHNIGPYVAIFDGDRTVWLDKRTSKTDGPVNNTVEYFETNRSYRELKPSEFFGLEELAKAGWNVSFEIKTTERDATSSHTQHKCHCDDITFSRYGCKCGGC